mgnify:CR=1 FL=1
MVEDETYGVGFRINQVAPSANGLNTGSTSISTLDLMLIVINEQTIRLNDERIGQVVNDLSVMRLWPAVISSSSQPKGDKIAHMARIAMA